MVQLRQGTSERPTFWRSLNPYEIIVSTFDDRKRKKDKFSMKVAPKPRKAFRDPVVSAPKARSGLKRIGKKYNKVDPVTNKPKKEQSKQLKDQWTRQGQKKSLERRN